MWGGGVNCWERVAEEFRGCAEGWILDGKRLRELIITFQ